MTIRGRLLVLSLHAGPEKTGNAPYVSSLVAGLAKEGWSVRLIAAHPHYPEWRIQDGYGQWRRDDVENGVRVVRLRHFVPRIPSGMRRLLAEVTFGLRVCATRWGRPDAIVLVSPAMISSAMAMMRARVGHRGVPTITWVQDLYSRGMAQTGTGGGISRSVVARLERGLLQSSDRVVVIHERFREILAGGLGVPDDGISVVRNWSHLSPTDAGIDPGETRRSLGWGEETVVLHGGNQGVKQGLENVVEAARLADRLGAPVRFVLLGQGSRHDALQLAAEGIDRIQFVGPMADDDYAAALAAADILLVNEMAGVSDMAVPSKLTSYFRSGRPVIVASEARSITTEELERAGAGVRVDPGRPQALIDAVLELGADTRRRDDLGRAGIAFARQKLDAGAAVRAFSSVIDDALAGRSGG